MNRPCLKPIERYTIFTPKMRTLFSFIRIAFRSQSIYRANFWVSILANFLLMYAFYSLWHALYEQRPNAFGVSLEQMTTYGVLAQVMLPVINASYWVQETIAQQVRSGLLEMDLMKPINFIWHMVCRNIGEMVVSLLTQGLPCLLFALLFLDILPPADWTHGLAYVVSFLLGYFIFVAVQLLMGMVAIVTTDIRSYSWAFNSIARFTSGSVVPLWMFPPALATVALCLPFYTIFSAPLSIYIDAQYEGVVTTLFIQVAWLIGMFTIVHLVWRRLYTRITIQGG